MAPRDALAQARHIYTTGSKIRNYFFKSHKKTVPGGRHTSGKKLSLSQFNVIDITITHGQITFTELSKMLGVSPPSTTAMVDRLVKKGFLIREHSSKDPETTKKWCEVLNEVEHACGRVNNG